MLGWIRARWWPGWAVSAVLLLLLFRGRGGVDTPAPVIRFVAAPSAAGTARASGGEVTVPTPNGPVIVKCPELELTNTCTAKVEVEYRDLVITVEKPRWQVGAGGGISAEGPVYYFRVGYRVLGPLGLDVIGLWPPCAMGGLNVAW